ncbi:MAG: TonB-dependent receptor domain-containing protein, partial [Geminicoccaceae bacterium]
HFQTEGFRENNDLKHDIYTLFGQSDLTESLSLQAEYRHRDTDRGDRRLQFDLDDFDPTLRDDIEEDVVRVGGRLTPAPGQIGLASAIYADREDRFGFGDGEVENERGTNVGQIEAQYLGTFGPLRLIAGAGGAVADSKRVERFQDGSRRRRDDEITAADGYLTANLALTPTLDLSARVGYADVEVKQGVNIERGGIDQVGMAGLTPAVGAIWRPLEALRLRAGAGRTIKRPFVANQTLQPTQVAGFNEQFDDLDGTRADWLGLAAEVRASEAVRFGAEMLLRRLARELAEEEDGVRFHKHDSQRDDRALVYLYWTPTERLAVSAELIGEHYSARERDNPEVLEVRTVSTPLELSYFMPSGWFATLGTAFVAQDVDLPGAEPGKKRDLDSHGVLVDLAAGYRLPKRRGIVALQLANLLDRRLAFQDESFRTSREEVNPRFLPSRTFLATLTLNF